MPIAKLKASGTSDVIKTEDTIDTIIRQAIGKEPFIPFPRVSESPVQWIQLLHALDPQGVSNTFSELPGWPLFSPLKVQLQKCDKCSREFCSPINYRRHIRAHHRLKKLDKDFTKTRDLLGAYWDKLSVEEAMEVVSFKNVLLEEVPGSSILKPLTTLIQNQGFYSFPQYYLMAGAALLDIVQSKPSSFPISSQELFNVLDDASEKTCLCGTAESMQRYVFDGEAGKTGLEPKNLVASTSFLLEQKLLKAWLADKDAEALRCQKQLVEEEDAAQKRQAEILERKRQKKLRQKEQKAREQRHKTEAEIKGDIDSTVKSLSLAEASLALSPAEASLDTYNFEAHNPNTFSDRSASPVPFQCPDTNEVINGYIHSESETVTDQNVERWSAHGQKHQCQAVARQQGLPKSQWTVANGLHTNQNSPVSKLEINQKYGTHCDQKASATVNGSKVWTRKSKTEIDKVVLKTIQEKEPDQVKNQEFLIGSISVNLSNCSQSEGNMMASQKDCIVENVGKQNISRDKPMKTDVAMGGNNRSTIKLWKPVSWLETKDPLPVQSGRTEVDAVHGNGQNLSGPSSLRVCTADGGDIGFAKYFSHTEGKADSGSLLFDIQAAKAFLAQRWKEAILVEHVTLVMCPNSEPPGCKEIQDLKTAVYQSSAVDSCNIVANADKRLPATSRVAKSKPRSKKSEKGTKAVTLAFQKNQNLVSKNNQDQQQTLLKNLNKPTTPPQQHKVGTFLSFNQLSSLAVVIVLAASGLVSPEDFAFVFFSLIYLHFIAKVAFPSLHPSRDPQEVFNPQNNLLQLYTLIGATIGLFTPIIAYIFKAVFEGDKEGIKAAAPHVFLLANQVFMEGVASSSSQRFSAPVRAFVPVFYNARRILTIVDWLRSEVYKIDGDHSGSAWRTHVGRALAMANMAYWSFNLFGFLLPVFLPKVLKLYYSSEYNAKDR